ncbi:hypothetical protein Nepgr_011505 [Nepenthes gracilis]|uniref:Cytochrome b5 heme-binding domain-containing protein n=1 Tax=Nepenthes gracilis TaxID=150966 RepID=A0AAD3SFG2_NEPGR|nr:hypothetical protein Nepgr_011505 [Nepenthes gracilis]
MLTIKYLNWYHHRLKMGLYAIAVEAINDYTGLSPTAFFTILCLMVITYKFVCGMFIVVDDSKAVRRRNEPVQLGEMTEEELWSYNGSDPNKPLLMAIKGQIYDVSSSRMFYGPGGAYSMFTGRDASRALALLSFKPQDLNGNLEGLGDAELDILRDWEFKFMEKYPRVGVITAKENSKQSGDKLEHEISDDHPNKD